MAQLRTRHDFFYFQIATMYMRNYMNVEKDFINKDYIKKHKDMQTDWKSLDLTNMSREEFNKILFKQGWQDYVSKFMQIRIFGNITAVFSALCLEALINDYCIINKSLSYFNNHIDKLDPASKWLLIPKIIIGKEIPTDGQAYELLKALYSYRNSLVHPKSKEIEPIDINSDNNQLSNDFVDFISNVSKCYAAIRYSTKELKGLDPNFKYLNDYEWLWTGDLSKFKNFSDIEALMSTFVSELPFIK